MFPATRIRFVLAMACSCLTAGCGGGSSNTAGTTSSTTTTTTTTAGASFYVVNDNDAFAPISPSTVLQFAKSSSGSVSPTTTITGPANVIFESIVEDPSGNLYVGGHTYNSAVSATAGPGTINIFEYAAGSSGTATPLRTISGLATGLQIQATNLLPSLDLDAGGNLYVAGDVAVAPGTTGALVPGISVFGPSANGNAAPTRVIAGDQTALFGPEPQLAVTSAGTVYVITQGLQVADSLVIFGPTASGNVAPTATIGGSNTTLYTIRGVALDSSGNIYVATIGKPTSTSADSAIHSIVEFAAGATGNVAPIRTISGSSTLLRIGRSLRVDSAGNIYVLNTNGILRFAPGASGNVAPAAAVTSAAFFTPSSSVAVQ